MIIMDVVIAVYTAARNGLAYILLPGLSLQDVAIKRKPLSHGCLSFLLETQMLVVGTSTASVLYW